MVGAVESGKYHLMGKTLLGKANEQRFMLLKEIKHQGVVCPCPRAIYKDMLNLYQVSGERLQDQMVLWFRVGRERGNKYNFNFGFINVSFMFFANNRHLKVCMTNLQGFLLRIL